MTRLEKPIRRITNAHVSQLPVIAALYPGGYPGLRLKGCRNEYQLALDTLYWQAAKSGTEKRLQKKESEV